MPALGGHMSADAKKRIAATRKRLGLTFPSRKGSTHSKKTRTSMSVQRKGGKTSIETRLKQSEALKGEKSHLWRGGLTETNKQIRHGIEYRLWREAVFRRDNWTCVWCLKRGVTLHPDHIKPFALFPELRFAIDNGRTLCAPCHRTTDTYGYKTRNKKL